LSEIIMTENNQDTQVGNGLGEASETDRQPWVEIENGRYQPQRIKGSCLGRELG
jgi:hypothetical protein